MQVDDKGYGYASFITFSNVSFAFAKLPLFNIFI